MEGFEVKVLSLQKKPARIVEDHPTFLCPCELCIAAQSLPSTEQHPESALQR